MKATAGFLEIHPDVPTLLALFHPVREREREKQIVTPPHEKDEHQRGTDVFMKEEYKVRLG